MKVTEAEARKIVASREGLLMKVKKIYSHAALVKEIEAGLNGLYDMPYGLYREAPGVSQSQLKRWIENPRLYEYELRHPKRSTEAMVFGSMFDDRESDREHFRKCYYVAPNYYMKEYKTVPPKRTQVTKTSARWGELIAENPGKKIITRSTMRKLVACSRSLWSHSETSGLLRGGSWQVSAFWDNSGVLCKGRTDYLTPNYIVDLKTTAKGDPRGFSYNARDFGYDCQAGWYSAGFGKFLPGLDAYYLAVVESVKAYRTTWFSLRDEDIERGAELLEDNLFKFAESDFGLKVPAQSGKLILEIPKRNTYTFAEEF